MQEENSISGFSLLEVTMVMLIGGIVLGAAASGLSSYIDTKRSHVTKERLEEVDRALQRYLSLNGRYPCPASVSAAVGSANFGIEVDANCASTSIPTGATFTDTGPDSVLVRIGAVPVRTLNLPEDFIGDPYGGRFTYAVTVPLASPGTYDRDGGDIAVIDSSGNSVINPAGSAHYVIVSHGEDSNGARTLLDGISQGCSSGPLDSENCDNDHIFRSTILRFGSSADRFDDRVRFRANSSIDALILPAGLIGGFDLSGCPPGWVAYSASGATLTGVTYCKKN